MHVDGSFALLVQNSTSMAHRDAAGLEPSTPSEENGLKPNPLRRSAVG